MSVNTHNRRQFFHTSGNAALVGMLGSLCGRLDAADGRDQKPLMRFVQWNDMHVAVNATTTYRLANEKMDYLVESINSETHFPMPDFVVGVGDMVHGENLAAISADFDLLKKKLARLKCPFYPVMGNHENVQQEGNPAHEAKYREVFGADKVNYTFERGGIQFVMLNDSGAPMSNPTAVGRGRNNWLRGVLEKSRIPCIICCHIPLVSIRQESVLKDSFGFSSYRAHDKELLGLVDTYSKRILAVLSGHLHLTGMVRRKGVYHITISGTASYPCEYAVYEVYKDRIRVRLHGLPEDLTTADTNIHGKRRHGKDYVDEKHPTHQAYVAGNASERVFDIPRKIGLFSIWTDR